MTLKDPKPALYDDEVVLRRWRFLDLDCVKAASEEGVIPSGTTGPKHFTVEAGEAFILRQHDRTTSGQGWSLAIADAETGEAIGCIVLMLRSREGVAGIGYWLVPEARGRGYATRAARLLSDWALGSAGLKRVEALVEPGNDASTGVMSRCGFEYEGRAGSFLTYSRTVEFRNSRSSRPTAMIETV